MNLSDHLSIGWHLFRREMVAFARLWRTGAIDALAMTSYGVLTFGYFMPAMGMPKQLALPLFMGSVITSVLFFGYHTGGIICQDLVARRVWQYHVSLPIPLWVMMGVQTISFMIRIMAFVLPVGILGVLIINQPALLVIKPLVLIPMVFLIALFFSLLFLWAVMNFSADHYYNDLWPRVLAPMDCFGCLFFTWKSFAVHQPILANLLLINPMTYCVEGLRAGLFDASNSLPVGYCLLIVFVSCVGAAIVARRAVIARLDLPLLTPKGAR